MSADVWSKTRRASTVPPVASSVGIDRLRLHILQCGDSSAVSLASVCANVIATRVTILSDGLGCLHRFPRCRHPAAASSIAISTIIATHCATCSVVSSATCLSSVVASARREVAIIAIHHQRCFGQPVHALPTAKDSASLLILCQPHQGWQQWGSTAPYRLLLSQACHPCR